MTPPDDTAALRAELDTLKQKVAVLADEAWYKKPTVLISIVALLFSFSTTIFAAYNNHQEDVRANRRDVRGILQRLSKLPIENYELLQKNKGAGQGEALAGMLNQENVLLATQAADAIERHPDAFTSVEYFAVALSLAASNITGRVPAMYQRALATATSSNDFNSAARAYGGYLYAKGETHEGKRLFAEAMGVWARFPERNAYIVNSVDLVTLMYWSQAELGAGNRDAARARIAEARQRLALLAPGPYTESLRTQLEYTAKFVE